MSRYRWCWAANNHPVARGEIQINEDKICITVTREADVYDFMAGG
jgi:flagellar motor switch protein FliN/FliY